MQYEKKIRQIGPGSVGILIPSDLAKYLGLDIGDEIVLQDDMGKHGKFLSMWKKGD